MVGLIDRERELAKLDELWARSGPALALLYGRRRIGKTYLLQHVLKRQGGVYFLAAESSSAENLEELLDQVRRTFPERQDAVLQNYPSWRVALRLLCELATDRPLWVAFDEFSYLCHVEPALPSLLQAVWDRDAPASRLKLVLCGSEVGMLGALDDYGRPLHGRFDWVEQYRPLDYYDAARFLLAGSTEHRYSPRDLLLAYGLFGGSGRYLAAIDPLRPLAANVATLLLDPLGVFHREGEYLIRQERDIRDYSNYNAVLAAIASGATEWGEIANQAHLEKHAVAACLERLQQLAWVIHEKPFEEPDRRGIYQIEGNFLKAWYRFVFRLRSALEMAPPEVAWAELVEPHLDDYMGRRVFESVCRQHLARLGRSHGLPLIVEIGRWWSRRSDVELDVVARLSDGSYLFGECKWSRSPVDIGLLFDLKRKVEVAPRGQWKASPRYALFSAGGFTPRLRDLAREESVVLVGPSELFRGHLVGKDDSASLLDDGR